MSEIKHEIKIDAPLEVVFKALTTVEGLKAWHTVDAQLKGDVITFHGDGKPLFRWQVVELVPNKKVVWKCLEGPGDSKGTESTYTLSTTSDNRTLVEFSHKGWPHQENNFRKCNTLWGILLHHLKKYAETHQPDPAIT